MNTTPSVSQTETNPAVAVIRQVRSRIGDRIHVRSYVQAGPSCLPALDLAKRLLNHFKTDADAAQHLTDGITSGRYRIVPRPAAPWKGANPAQPQRAARRARAAGLAMVDELQRGHRIVATRHGATKATAVRDAAGKVDVLETARRHGLFAEARGPDDLQAARLDAGDLATRLAFPQ